MVLADRAVSGWRKEQDLQHQASEHDRRAGYDWGRRGLPASLWLTGRRPAGFDEACRAGQAVWRLSHTCPECGIPISSERAAMDHWKERHAPRRRP